MKLEFKDVWHLYFGCPVIDVNYPEEGSTPLSLDLINAYSEGEENSKWIDGIKPILRPLSDLTDDEMEVIALNIFYVTPHLAVYEFVSIKSFLADNICINVGESETNPLPGTEYPSHPLDGYELSPNQFFQLTTYLLRQGFDLHSLIPTGQAIEQVKPSADGLRDCEAIPTTT